MAFNTRVDRKTTTRFHKSERTYDDIGKFLGDNPHKFGLVSSMYKDLTATYLTESLLNIYTNDKKGGKFQEINSMAFEWDNDLEFIKYVEFAEQPSEPIPGGEIKMVFRDNYYDQHDTFVIDGSRQVCYVQSGPLRISDDYWEYIVELIDPDKSEILDIDACLPGMTTRWRSNYHPELSERGYAKEQSSTEKHRNYISLHRSDVYGSQKYNVLEDTFLNIAKGEKSIRIKMNKLEKTCLDTFLQARNNSLVWGKSNVDANGKPTTKDRKTQRPVYMGDGIIPQIERYADCHVYAPGTLTISDFKEAMGTMREKSKQDEGNHWMFMINRKLSDAVQDVLLDYLKDFKTDGAFLYSAKGKNNKVSVGTTFSTYEYQGNFLTIKTDRALSTEYPNSGYGIMIDLTPDETNNQAALSMITLKGSGQIMGTIKGLGGMSGSESGDVATPLAGSGHMIMGYAGVMVAAPYRSFLFIENVY